MKLKMVVLSVFALSFLQSAWAQEDWENDGEIEDVEIEIVKDLEIKLPTASRNFDKIQPVNTGVDEANIEYYFNTLSYSPPALDLRIRPLRIKEQPLNKFYGNYVKAGFGNYVTPYFEAYVNSKRNKHYTYGSHINFINSKNGPVDDDNSGSGRFDVDLFGKVFGKIATLSGDLGYHRSNFHFYGYDEGLEVEADSIRQIYNHFNARVALENTNKSDAIQYKLALGYDHIQDNYNASEGELQLDFNAGYDFSDDVFINISSSYNNITQKDEAFDVNRNLFKIRPVVGLNITGFDAEVGFNAVYEDDTLGGPEELHFYPLAKATYSFSDYLQVYAGIRGDITKQTYRKMVGANPFLQSNQLIFNNNKTFDFYGGVTGKVTSKISYGAGLSIANYQNLHYFINDQSDQSRFVAAFDSENTAVVNLFGEISYSNDVFRSALRADYFGYDASDEIGGEAWHRPNYEIALVSAYNLYDKLLFNAELYAFGGIKAIDLTTDTEVDLDAAFDFNFKTEYLISNQVSAFVQFNNIFSQSYQRFYRYPSRELQFMAGVTYSF